MVPVIPLRKIAREILEDRFRTAYVPLTNAEFNRHIKTVAKLAGNQSTGKTLIPEREEMV